MPAGSPIDPATLVKEAVGLRRLARGLVADATRADDATQDTLAMALEQGPRAGFAPAAWLRGVLRNVVRRTRRSEARRLAREHGAARPERAPAQESADRLARRRLVLDAVLALPESQRTVLELRFFEGLPPRAIAKRLGVPVETVRSRVRLAIEHLRAEFDRREHGAPDARRRWLVALAPLAFPSRADVGPWIVGGLVMGAKAKVALAAAAVLAMLVGGAVWLGGSDESGSTTGLSSPSPIAPTEPTAG